MQATKAPVVTSNGWKTQRFWTEQTGKWSI